MTTNTLSVLPLGGVGEIGRNCMVYEANGEMILVDVGVSFGDDTTPGIDLVLPDTKYVRQNLSHLQGIFITHAHEDHIGAVAYVWEETGEVPVYLTPFAACVLRDKLSQLGLDPQDSRINVVNAGEPVKLGENFTVEYVHTTHSIPEANMLYIKTPHGNLVHTGDYKFDDEPVLGEATNWKRLEEMGAEGVMAVMADSTGVFNDREAESETKLAERLDAVCKQTKNRLFFASFSSNVGRLLKMAEIAQRNGRKVCLLGRTAQKMVQHAKTCGYFPETLHDAIITGDEAAALPRNEVMVFASGTQGEGNASLTRLSQGNNIRGIEIDAEDTVLMSSKMIPGNERKILDVINALTLQGAEVIYDAVADVHVSGHAGRGEMRKLYDVLKPDMLVPVHGEAVHLQEHCRLGKECGIRQTFELQNGFKLSLVGKEAGTIQKHGIPHGVNYVDGYNILDEDRFIVQDRVRLAHNGLVCVALSMQKGQLRGKPSIHTKGLMDEKLQEDVLHKMQTAVADAVRNHKGRKEERGLYDTIRRAVRHVVNQERGKRPEVITVIV